MSQYNKKTITYKYHVQKKLFESIQQLNQKVDNINKRVNKIESDINNIVKPNNLKR